MPSPGRSSCTIRELPSRPFRAGRVLPYPGPTARPSHRQGTDDRSPRPRGSPRQRFRSRLAARPLLVDGGLGTLLFSRGVPQRACLEELVIDPSGDGRGRPSGVSRGGRRADRDAVLRRQPAAAGGVGPRGRGRRDSTGARRSSPATRARSAAATRSSVARSGRSVRRRAAGRPIAEAAARAAFREQIDGLLEGGADLIVLETFSDLDQLVARGRRGSPRLGRPGHRIADVRRGARPGRWHQPGRGRGGRWPRRAPMRSGSTAEPARRPVSTRSR